MIFIYYPKCSTCQKAKNYLEKNNIKFIERNIISSNPSYEELKEWYSNNNYDIKKYFNTSGLLYKELNLKEKLNDMTEDEKLKLLSQNGMLVKRPLIIDNDKLLIGFNEQEWNEKLLCHKKKRTTYSLSSKVFKTGEDIAMLNDRKNTKKEYKNICDTHWDGA